jgi:hypothetical protein
MLWEKEEIIDIGLATFAASVREQRIGILLPPAWTYCRLSWKLLPDRNSLRIARAMIIMSTHSDHFSM